MSATPALTTTLRPASTTSLEPPTSWRDRAACIDEDPMLFYPEDAPRRDAAALAEEAKAICARCPVRTNCLEAELRKETGTTGRPLSAGFRHGIRGGLDGDERRALAMSRWEP